MTPAARSGTRGAWLIAAPETQLSRGRVALLFIGLVAVIAVAGASTPQQAALPIFVAMGVGAVLLALTDMWRGLLLTTAAITLLPQPFSVNLGGVTVTVGRVVLFSFLCGWVALRRVGDERQPSAAHTSFLVLMMGTLVASTLANVASLPGDQLLGSLRKIGLFGVDFCLLSVATVAAVRSRERAVKFLRYFTGLIAVTAGLGLVEWFTEQNVFELLHPILPDNVNRTIGALANAAELNRGHISRVHSTFEQPLGFAAVLLIALPLAAAFAHAAEDRRQRRLWIVAIALIATALMFTASRSAYLIVLVVILTLFVVAPDARARSAIVLATLAVTGAFFLQPEVRDTMLHYFQPRQGEQFEGSIQSRVDALGAVSGLIKDRSLFGFGPGSFSNEQLTKNKLLATRVTNQVLDDAYLEHLGETGIVGIVGLGGVLFFGWLQAWRIYRDAYTREERLLGGALLAAIHAWFLFSFFADVYVFNAQPRLFFVLLGIVCVLRMEQQSARRDIVAEDRAQAFA